MEPERIQNLQMIGGVIQRMGQNSFAIKGWCTTLVAAILALAAKDADVHIIFVILLPTVVFWTLDAYYLWQERRFRALYDRVRVADEKVPLFSMDVSGETHVRFGRSLRAIVVWPFYAVMIVTSAVVFILLTHYHADADRLDSRPHPHPTSFVAPAAFWTDCSALTPRRFPVAC
jgi:hypothetical protein